MSAVIILVLSGGAHPWLLQTSEMEHFVIIHVLKPLSIVTKHSILDVGESGGYVSGFSC